MSITFGIDVGVTQDNDLSPDLWIYITSNLCRYYIFTSDIPADHTTILATYADTFATDQSLPL